MKYTMTEFTVVTKQKLVSCVDKKKLNFYKTVY